MRYWIILLFFAFNHVSALTETSVKKAGSLQFQIIQADLTFDYTNIKKASLVSNANGSVSIKLELKNDAADALKQLTYENIGKSANIIFNDRVVSASMIQTTLNNKIIITGFTQHEANLFLQTLKYEDKNQAKNKRPTNLLDRINDNQPALIQVGKTVQNSE